MYTLTPAQISRLTALRHDFHRQPEISGHEEQTAARIVQELSTMGADLIWKNLGGHGVAAEFRGKEDGPTVMIRCELDALPIVEQSTLPYRSEIPGKAHLCGHDGHMCIVLGVGLGLMQRPSRGRVVLLFQPAEETGVGAQAVIEDPRWPQIRPDYAFSYHNVPGRPLAEIGLRQGPANCASRGMQIRFHGKTSHAAAPEDGISPGQAMASLVQQFSTLSTGSISDSDYALCTLTHVRLGEPTFGVAPGEGEMRLTLRCMTDTGMAELIGQVETMLDAISEPLDISITWHDIFPSSENDVEATDIARQAARVRGLDIHEMDQPMRWSEDFGRFALQGVKSTMMFLGAGESQPQLHNPDYDFPDALIPTGTELLLDTIHRVLDCSRP
ncbi:amidohydrolase [Granulosicoccus sp. 3-233]|uniref:amidohydrolase n=1 Tax=Granulosicoccus sp. 3-233 TaxID=3417969 RepID=UPI003D33B7E6